MEDVKKLVIGSEEHDLPEGIAPLGEDGLYLVDWNLVEIAKEPKKGEKFEFFNPRHLGQYEVDAHADRVEVFLGQGFGREEMHELMDDIVQNGLNYPFLCYPFLTEDGKIKVRIHDGERRWRCIDRLIEKKEKVFSTRNNQYLAAGEVYASVICRVSPMTEEEAFMRACAVSETAVKWGDGANARLVKTLYDMGKKDEEICKLLNKSKQWLAETYSLNELDDYCFSFLLSNRINRKVALDLAKVKDVKLRCAWLDGAWKDALDNHAALEAKNEKMLQKAEANEELAQAEVEEAKDKGAAPEEIEALQEAAAEATEKTQKRKQIKAASAKPMAKSKNLRKSAGGLLSNALRPPKIKKKLEAVEDMIEKNDNSLVDLKILQVLKIAYQAILDGEEDVKIVLAKLAG